MLERQLGQKPKLHDCIRMAALSALLTFTILGLKKCLSGSVKCPVRTFAEFAITVIVPKGHSIFQWEFSNVRHDHFPLNS